MTAFEMEWRIARHAESIESLNRSFSAMERKIATLIDQLGEVSQAIRPSTTRFDGFQIQPVQQTMRIQTNADEQLSFQFSPPPLATELPTATAPVMGNFGIAEAGATGSARPAPPATQPSSHDFSKQTKHVLEYSEQEPLDARLKSMQERLEERIQCTFAEVNTPLQALLEAERERQNQVKVDDRTRSGGLHQPDFMAGAQALVHRECENLKHHIKNGLKTEIKTELLSELEQVSSKPNTFGSTSTPDQFLGLMARPIGEPYHNVVPSEEGCKNLSMAGLPFATPNMSENILHRLNSLEEKQTYIEVRVQDLMHQGVQLRPESSHARAAKKKNPSETKHLQAEKQMNFLGRLHRQVAFFVKKAMKGCRCTHFLKGDANHSCQTLYKVDETLDNLIIVSSVDSARAEVICPLSDVHAIYSLAEDGKGCFPSEIVAKLTQEEQELLLMVELKNGKSEMLKFCIMEKSIRNLHRFLECMRILCIYAQSDTGCGNTGKLAGSRNFKDRLAVREKCSKTMTTNVNFMSI